jgi:hypothetical protein
MTKESLYSLAKDYVAVIDRIEHVANPDLLAELEEWRAEKHDIFMKALRREGIRFKDREHVTRIAYRIVEEEL